MNFENALLQSAVVVFLLAGLALSEDYFTGIVRSSDGRPLAGVSVSDGKFNGTETDSDGKFRIKRSGQVYFFRLPGYEPRTEVLTADQINLSVEMESSKGKTWLLTNCDPLKTIDKTAGLHVKYALPKQARLKITNDDDYEIRWVQYPQRGRKEYLALWEGATASLGHPLAEDFLGASEFQEQSITFENRPGAEGEDVRGTLKSGKAWRWAGFLGQFAEYRNVSKDAAAYFDKIIDSMCSEEFRVSHK